MDDERSFMRIPIDRYDICALLIVSTTLALVVALGSQNVAVSPVISIAAVVFSGQMIGRAVLSLAPELPYGFRAVTEIPVGMTMISIVVLFVIFVFAVSAGTAFIGSSVFGLISLIYNMRKPRGPVWDFPGL